VIVLATKVIPRLFNFIVKTKIHELFLLSVLATCFSVAFFAEWLGLSLSIGAFLAGLIVSESEYWHQALGDMRSLQDVFTSFFFVSIGMLVDMSFVVTYLPLVLLICGAVMVMKAACTAFAGIVIGVPLRTVLLASFALCQVGEFSFVLAKAGQEVGLGSDF